MDRDRGFNRTNMHQSHLRQPSIFIRTGSINVLAVIGIGVLSTLMICFDRAFIVVSS